MVDRAFGFEATISPCAKALAGGTAKKTARNNATALLLSNLNSGDISQS